MLTSHFLNVIRFNLFNRIWYLLDCSQLKFITFYMAYRHIIFIYMLYVLSIAYAQYHPHAY